MSFIVKEGLAKVSYSNVTKSMVCYILFLIVSNLGLAQN